MLVNAVLQSTYVNVFHNALNQPFFTMDKVKVKQKSGTSMIRVLIHERGCSCMKKKEKKILSLKLEVLKSDIFFF